MTKCNILYKLDRMPNYIKKKITGKMDNIYNLLELAKQKSKIDENSSWKGGSKLYLEELKNEVDEVLEEYENDRKCYIEDELGDILWDYLNTLISMEKEKNIEIKAVFERAFNKYSQRIDAMHIGQSWDLVKQRQKEALLTEWNELKDKE